MSNNLYIELIESRTAGTNDPFTFSLMASDTYGTFVDTGYASIEALLEAYPNRLDVLYTLEGKPEFEEAYEIVGGKVIMNSVSNIIFEGFPEDDSIEMITHLGDSKYVGFVGV